MYGFYALKSNPHLRVSIEYYAMSWWVIVLPRVGESNLPSAGCLVVDFFCYPLEGLKTKHSRCGLAPVAVGHALGKYFIILCNVLLFCELGDCCIGAPEETCNRLHHLVGSVLTSSYTDTVYVLVWCNLPMVLLSWLK